MSGTRSLNQEQLNLIHVFRKQDHLWLAPKQKYHDRKVWWIKAAQITVFGMQNRGKAAREEWERDRVQTPLACHDTLRQTRMCALPLLWTELKSIRLTTQFRCHTCHLFLHISDLFMTWKLGYFLSMEGTGNSLTEISLFSIPIIVLEDIIGRQLMERCVCVCVCVQMCT